MVRLDGRKPDQIRPVRLTRNFNIYAEGSVLAEMGNTRVLCTASVEDRVPPFLKGSKKGWVTAEYSMLPRSTQDRTVRESSRGKVGGRTQEIQRLIARSLRSVVDLEALGEKTIWIDCDVLQADGGTRTASITGGFVALVDALKWLKNRGELETLPIVDYMAAVSVGKVDDQLLLDLCYTEDSQAQVDLNLVMTAGGQFIEIQGTAEEYPFTKEELDNMLSWGKKGIEELILMQKTALAEISGG